MWGRKIRPHAGRCCITSELGRPRWKYCMKLLPKLSIAFGVVVATFIALATCNYVVLWKPSSQGKCSDQTTFFRGPVPTRPHLAELRGQVVGKNLWIVQYR